MRRSREFGHRRQTPDERQDLLRNFGVVRITHQLVDGELSVRRDVLATVIPREASYLLFEDPLDPGLVREDCIEGAEVETSL